MAEREGPDDASSVRRLKFPRVTLRDLLALQQPDLRRAAGTLADTMSAVQAAATARLLPQRDIEAPAQPVVEDAALDIHARQFRAELPQRDPERAELVARAWQERWGSSIDDDRLTLAVSVVPAQRLRQEAQLLDKLPALERMLRAMEAISKTTAQNAVDPRLARLCGDLRDLTRELARLDERTAAERMTRAWWSAERTRAADVARAWCVARQPRPSDGLWWTIISLLWYHGWDVDPAKRNDVARLKTAWTTWRHKEVGTSTSRRASVGRPCTRRHIHSPRPPRRPLSTG